MRPASQRPRSSLSGEAYNENGLGKVVWKRPRTKGVGGDSVVVEEHRLPPCRSIFFADVVRTTTHPGVADEAGRLDSASRPFFGMTAGNGEFWTWKQKVGHIGMSVGRDDIRY